MNDWYDDRSPGSRLAGGRYYMTNEEKQKYIAAGSAPVKSLDEYTSVMWEGPRRHLRDQQTGKLRNTTWEANLSLVNVNKNNASLIVFAYGFSIKKGVLSVTKPIVKDKSN